jgi:hypothetical protein
MPKLLAAPLPDGCPWSGWTPPNVDWCEEELCGWIVNPADTWSNLAYVAFGLLMWWIARQDPDRRRALFGPASVLVGAFSFAYHASYTYFLQFFDFVGMFVFCFTVISVNAVRLRWVDLRGQLPVFVGGVVVFSLAVPVLSETTLPIQSLVAILIATILSQEAVLYSRVRQSPHAPRYATFALAIGLLTGGAAASLADVTRTWCDPQNHWLQGHALWHILTAASLYALFTFYGHVFRGADEARDPAPGR